MRKAATWLLAGTLFSGCAANHPARRVDADKYVQIRSDVNYWVERKAETLDLFGNLLYLFSPEAKTGRSYSYYFSNECRFAPQGEYPFEHVERELVAKVCKAVDKRPKNNVVTSDEIVLPLLHRGDFLHTK